MQFPKIYYDIINHSTHLLIAGATGSGKSVTLHGIITALILSDDPPELCFIDLKRVEMQRYKKIASAYANNGKQALQLLETLHGITEQRYYKMEKQHIEKWNGRHIYLIIDEYAELLYSTNKKCIPLVQSIMQLSRAAGIHIILATQCVLREILSTPIKCNFDSFLALRCRSKQDSRNIINCAGAELLPRYGKGIFISPDFIKPVTVCLPKVENKDLLKRI